MGLSMACASGDYKVHRIRALALRVESRLDRTCYQLLARDWSMQQLPTGRMVNITCGDMLKAA